MTASLVQSRLRVVEKASTTTQPITASLSSLRQAVDQPATVSITFPIRRDCGIPDRGIGWLTLNRGVKESSLSRR